ncbi:MAG TPA: hypothetical protein VFM54_16480, partial [Micromonosporaceae bacterium]|nr:hypothetical protein [Micromonosporaceae bacterium]
ARFLTVGLAVGLPFGIISGIAVDWMYGYGFGLPGGYMAGLISRSATGPRPQQTQFHLRGHISTLLKPTAVGLLCGLAGGLLFDLAGWLAIGLVLGLGGGLLLLMEDLAVTPKVDAVFSPPDLLRMDRSRTVSIMVMVGLLFGALGLTDGFIDGLQFGVAYALGIMLASAAWVQWLVCTRLWLPATGKLPWRIIAFLTDAHQRGVLRQAGGVYRYRHALLRDQLAHHTTDPRPQPHHQPQHNSPNPKRPPPPAHTCQRPKR